MEIENYPNYLIYEDGRVFSKYRNKFMKNQIGTNGYLQIHVRNDNGSKWFRIHRLIALYYIPNPYNYDTVDHIDSNIKNNDIKNLQWVTRSMNSAKANSRPSNTKEKNISYIFDKTRNSYHYKIRLYRNGKYILNTKRNTLEEAIKVRDEAKKKMVY